ncbi:MAG: ATP-binding protein [Candidatus Thorarchaeota archaeon]
MTTILDRIETTEEVPISDNPLEMVIGQDHAVSLVKSAVLQRRHVLLCGVPGIGKSMLAKAAHSLLPPPRSDIVIQQSPSQPDRPIIVERIIEEQTARPAVSRPPEVVYTRPEDLPFEVASKMGYRCNRCGSLSIPSHPLCMDCGYPKRAETSGTASYVGLMRELDVISEPALTSVTHVDQEGARITFRRGFDDTIMIIYDEESVPHQDDPVYDENASKVLVSHTSSRFVHVSGFSPVELLGDVKHDPYGSAENLGLAAYLRVVPGAIHEAHEGILYIDEIAALGGYQKHLLTAMQDKTYPISGHNPQSSGAAVRVDNVPCDFLLFAACNVEDLPKVIPPLRSRIRGYGYEIMLDSWMPKTEDNIGKVVRFIAQTVTEDGKIPHMTSEAARKVLEIAEEYAFQMDGQRNALTLRLRELGGLVRIAGDIAVDEGGHIIEADQVSKARTLSRGIDSRFSQQYPSAQADHQKTYGDYFF